jgi:hypothetical protein
MQHIPLTKNKVVIVDDIDFDLAGFKWRENVGYAVREIWNGSRENRTSQLMHRVILSRKIGRELRKGELCDHINRDGLDNRRSNLRIVSKSQNNANAIKKSGNYKGVTYRSDMDKWAAQIMKNYKQNYIGYYDTEIEAAQAYMKKLGSYLANTLF